MKSLFLPHWESINNYMMPLSLQLSICYSGLTKDLRAGILWENKHETSSNCLTSSNYFCNLNCQTNCFLHTVHEPEQMATIILIAFNTFLWTINRFYSDISWFHHVVCHIITSVVLTPLHITTKKLTWTAITSLLLTIIIVILSIEQCSIHELLFRVTIS